ncbi:long-chain-fatty-acid--CoA ligase [Cystobacter fuscus]|uniref:Long-chain-fatty-acid--CoA ligase n=1 Tax=Cystobacter fuscus TaxID=43 RepID=A0A250JFP9_9BACT|nr:AMP-binding protein [Cystobacter fuscus]ATB42430.1 long-chain-fatty-acid--CoA ligase [Cystobacter fuscus]
MTERSTNHIAAEMRRRAKENPAQPAFVMQGLHSRTIVTYGAFVERVARATAFLIERGLKRGERCALIGTNHPDWCAAWYAIVGLGAVAVTLDPQLSPEALGALMKDAGARFAIVDAKAQAQSAAWTQLEQVFSLNEQAHGVFSSDAAAPEELVGGGDELAGLLYTSGTTSEPKGVMLTHTNLLVAVNGIILALRASRDDVILSVLPFFHILAQIGGMLAPLAVGATVVLLPELEVTRITGALRDGGITIFFCVPQFYHLFLRRVRAQIDESPRLRRMFPRLLRWNRRARAIGLNAGKVLFKKVHATFGPKIRALISGGAALDPEAARTFYALGIDILQVYGLTETTGAIALGRPGETVIGTVGRAVPGVEFRIDVPDGRGSPQAPGEVFVRSAMVMPGYYNRPGEAKLEDGWFHTGDLGYLDPDGYLYVLGRTGDTIVLPSGKKIQPSELETHFARSKLIAEVGVTLATGDTGSDPRLHLVVVPDLEAIRATGTGNVEQVLHEEIARLSAALPSYKRVVGVTITREPLPRTTTRKLKRAALQEWVKASQAAEHVGSKPVWRDADRAWAEVPAHARALELIAARASLPREELHPDLHLDLDLGLDSLARLSLLSDLDVNAVGEVLATVQSVRELVEATAHGTPAPAAPATSPPPPRSLALTLLAFVLLRGLRGLEWLLLGVRVKGAEHLRPSGAALICANHQSFLDVFVLLSVLPWSVFRRTCMVGKPKYFGGPLMPLARRIGVMPIDASRNLPTAIEESVARLERGAVLIVFPEGTRSRDGALLPFRHGATVIAQRARAPIIPVAIDGAYRVMPRDKFFPRLHRVTLRAGAALLDDPSADVHARTDTLRARIAALLQGAPP